MKVPRAVELKILALAGEQPPTREAPPQAAPRILIEVEVPVRTVSESNTGGTLRGKLARKAMVKAAIRDAMPKVAGGSLPLPAVVTLTRKSPARQDDDNVRGTLKAVRDVVSDWLGLPADNDPRVKWRYRQRPGYSAAVVIRIETRRE